MTEIWYVDQQTGTCRGSRLLKGLWHKKLRNSCTHCAWCQRRFTTKSWGRATIDHILPTSLKGRDARENIKVSCAWCNEGRASVGHCIVALVCLESIVGHDVGKIARYYYWSLIKDVEKLIKP
jgi:hypothetical protein